MSDFLKPSALNKKSIAVVYPRTSDVTTPRCYLTERKHKEGKKVKQRTKRNTVTDPKFDGYGGRFKRGDKDIYGTALRKLSRKANVTTTKEDLILVGVVNVFFPRNASKIPDRTIYYFFLYRFEGRLEETEKMKPPSIFSAFNAPYESMRPVDQVILPAILRGNSLKGKVFLAEDGKGRIVVRGKSLTMAFTGNHSEKTDKYPAPIM